jgi:hypothetical protein
MAPARVVWVARVARVAPSSPPLVAQAGPPAAARGPARAVARPAPAAQAGPPAAARGPARAVARPALAVRIREDRPQAAGRQAQAVKQAALRQAVDPKAAAAQSVRRRHPAVRLWAWPFSSQHASSGASGPRAGARIARLLPASTAPPRSVPAVFLGGADSPLTARTAPPRRAALPRPRCSSPPARIGPPRWRERGHEAHRSGCSPAC